MHRPPRVSPLFVVEFLVATSRHHEGDQFEVAFPTFHDRDGFSALEDSFRGLQDEVCLRVRGGGLFVGGQPDRRFRDGLLHHLIAVGGAGHRRLGGVDTPQREAGDGLRDGGRAVLHHTDPLGVRGEHRGVFVDDSPDPAESGDGDGGDGVLRLEAPPGGRRRQREIDVTAAAVVAVADGGVVGLVGLQRVVGLAGGSVLQGVERGVERGVDVVGGQRGVLGLVLGGVLGGLVLADVGGEGGEIGGGIGFR